MSRMFEIEVDVTQLDLLTEKLGRLDGRRLAEAAADAVNVVTTRFDRKQRAGQIADIALSPDDVARRTRVKLAKPDDTTATITTAGDLTVMTHYPHSLLPARDRVDRAGRRFGLRQAGVQVGIKRSAPVDEPQWFLMRLKNTGRLGVFVRTGADSTKHLYGPSPYSLFRFQIRTGEAELAEDLKTTGAAEIGDAVEKAFDR